MPSPIEAESRLKDAPVSKSRKNPGVSLDNTLGRTLAKAWGNPYNHNLYVFSVLLARKMFCCEASPRAMMLNFDNTFKNLVKHSRKFTKLAWCQLLANLLRTEALVNRKLGEDNVSVETVIAPRNRTHFTFDLPRWFPKIKGARQKIQARMVAIKAAKACRVSPMLYLWENGLVDFSFFSR